MITTATYFLIGALLALLTHGACIRAGEAAHRHTMLVIFLMWPIVIALTIWRYLSGFYSSR